MKAIITHFVFLIALICSNLSFGQTSDGNSQSHKENLIGVRLSEIKKYTKSLTTLTLEDVKKVKERLNSHLPSSKKLSGTKALYLYGQPKIGTSQTELPLIFFGRLQTSGQYTFHRTLVIKKGGQISYKVIDSISLKETQFRLSVSLADRKLVLIEDRYNFLNMVFPLGVGAFDERVLNEEVTLLTPRFENAYIDKRTVITKRKKPRYFAGRPFIRITTDINLTEGHTAIGFHVQPFRKTFVRAFDSHGCMRLQEDDLYLVHDIVKEGPHPRLRIDVKFFTEDKIDHPFPLKNKPFRKVLNAGSEKSPRWKLDRDGLVQTHNDWERKPPIEELEDLVGDHHHSLYDYDMDWRKKQRYEELKQKCLQSNNYWEQGISKRTRSTREKAFKKCMKKSRPKKRLKDRLYRWWVH